jgi:hypothetical protein
VSARHTSTIYKISGQDGRVIWRLGGYASDFIMEEGLQFSWQHHVRFQWQNETTTIISVLDNSADDQGRNPEIPRLQSSAKIIALDTSTTPMTARLVRKYERPDGGSSEKLGSVQVMGENAISDNIFVGWGEQGSVSEYNTMGELVLQARFHSDRMMSYRSHKAQWVGMPTQPPDLKVLPTTFGEGKPVSAFYVSWNGATEVAQWSFYGSDTPNGTFTKIGSATKNGFETTWMASELVHYSYAEAVDKNNNILGQSPTQSVDPPIDGDFQAIYPLLASVDVHSSMYSTVVDALTQSSQQQEPPQAEMQDEERISPAYASLLSTIIVDAFALWGVYCILRHVVPHSMHWWKGYKSLSLSDQNT